MQGKMLGERAGGGRPGASQGAAGLAQSPARDGERNIELTTFTR
jgi:hypothetical protein